MKRNDSDWVNAKLLSLTGQFITVRHQPDESTRPAFNLATVKDQKQFLSIKKVTDAKIAAAGKVMIQARAMGFISPQLVF